MELESLMELCGSMPNATHDIKWENHLCYNIGGKMFIIIGLDNSPISASFKVSEEDFPTLSTHQNCIPAPYLARYSWVFTNDISTFEKAEWQEIIQNSYSLVLKKLPKRIRETLS